jgi:hypothetical protein
LKNQPRFLGIDDSPFAFKEDNVLLVGVVTRGASYVEAVLSTHVAVDGTDATEKLSELVGRSRFHEHLEAVFLNGIAVGGFNVVDVDALAKAVRAPVLAITRDRPDFAKIKGALEKHVPDWEPRWRLLDEARIRPLRNGDYTIWGTVAGCTDAEAEALVRKATTVGAVPEPVRLAHVIASGVVRGESRGKA